MPWVYCGKVCEKPCLQAGKRSLEAIPYLVTCVSTSCQHDIQRLLHGRRQFCGQLRRLIFLPFHHESDFGYTPAGTHRRCGLRFAKNFALRCDMSGDLDFGVVYH